MSSARAEAKERVGRYEVYSEIASGGMATVCFGRQVGDVGFARTVAIKRLHPHVARDPDFVNMFLDEARLATRIQNAHVVQTLDVVASGGELLLVMEYVHGEALSKLLTTAVKRRERVDPRIAVAIAIGILEGLHAAHEAKNERGQPLEIVHRDISPQNVIVGLDGVARVFDFGIAKAADRLHTTQDGSLKGKIAYMAPEQLENEPADRRTDVWAASVVLWEMLTNKRLFVADSQAALVRVVLTREVPEPSVHGAPKALDAILAKGLTKDPTQRFATAREMALALEEALPAASPRMVGGWVERNASAELEARAKLLEDVESHAVNERPSGATKVEVSALMEPGEATVTAVTTAMASPVVEAEKTAVYARNAHAEKTVALPSAPFGASLEATRAKPLLPRTMRLETPFGVQPMGAQGSKPPPARSGIPPIAALAAAAVGMVVAVIAAIAIFGSKSSVDPKPAVSADPFPPPPSASITAPAVGTVIGSSTPATTTTTTTTATATATATAPTTFKRPPRPVPSGSSASGKKCTPFDFDYPACLKH